MRKSFEVLAAFQQPLILSEYDNIIREQLSQGIVEYVDDQGNLVVIITIYHIMVSFVKKAKPVG